MLDPRGILLPLSAVVPIRNVHALLRVSGGAGKRPTIRLSPHEAYMQLQTRASPDRARIDVFDGRHLLGLNQEAFARRGAEILGTLNAVHPFREGNGTQREFVRELAHKNGYWVDWSKVSRGELYKRVT